MGHNSKCFVPYCKSGYNSCKNKYSLFSVPKDANLRKLWDKAICRPDRKLTERDVVCAKHFVEADIKKVWVSGDIIIPYKKPRLIPLAVPSVFPYSTPLNKTKPKTKTRRKNKHNKSPKSAPSTSTVDSSISELVSDETNSTNNVFEELWLKQDILKMPNAEWALRLIDKNEKRRILISESSVTNDGAPCFLRNIILEHDSQLKVFLGSVEIAEDILRKLSVQPTQPANVSDVQDYLDRFSNTKICAGGPSTKIYNLNKVAIKTAKIDVNGLWRHVNCLLILNDSDRRCTWCKRVYDYFINYLLSSKP